MSSPHPPKKKGYSSNNADSAVPYHKDATMQANAVHTLITRCIGGLDKDNPTPDEELHACPGKIRAAMNCQFLADTTIQQGDDLRTTVSNMCGVLRKAKGSAGDLTWAPKAVGMYISLLMKGLDLLGCDGMCPDEPAINKQAIEAKRLALRKAVAGAMGIEIYCPNCKSKAGLSASGAGGKARIDAALSCLKRQHMTPPAAIKTKDTGKHQAFTACYDSIMALTCDDMQELKAILKSAHSTDLCKVIVQGLNKITIRQINIYGSVLAMSVSMVEMIQCPAVAQHAEFSSGCPDSNEIITFYNALKKAMSKNMRLVCDPCSTCSTCSTCAKAKQGLPVWVKVVLPVVSLVVLLLVALTVYFAMNKAK